MMNKIYRILFTVIAVWVVTFCYAGTVVLKTTTNGTVEAKVNDVTIAGPSDSSSDKTSADQAGGTTVTLEIAPTSGYYLYQLAITPYASGGSSSAPRRAPTVLSNITPTKIDDNEYTFIMPANMAKVEISATFAQQGDLSTATITLQSYGHTYDFLEHTPKVNSVVLNSVTLTEGTDYTVSGNGPVKDVKAGGYTITVTGKGKYTGSNTATYMVSARDISSATIALLDNSFVYNKGVQIPTISGVFISGQTLSLTNDCENLRFYTGDYTSSEPTSESFDLSTTNKSINKGPYTVAIDGKGNFSGTVKTKYIINAKPITSSDMSVTQSGSSYTYNGTSQAPTITVTDGTALTYDTDYTLNWSSGGAVPSPSAPNSTAVGNYDVVVSGINNYTGSVTKQYTINASNSGYYIVYKNGSEYSITDHNETYTGSSIELIPATSATEPSTANMYVKKMTGSTPNPDSDETLGSANYELAYTNNVNVGWATVTAIGKAGYSFTASNKFKIVAKDITNNVNITINPGALTYNTTTQKPSLVVRDKDRHTGATPTDPGELMEENIDYTIGEGATTAGNQTITITGKGNYTGTKSANYTISPLSLNGADVTLTPTTYTYNGSEQFPDVMVRINGIVIPSGDYTATLADKTNAGDKTVTITASSSGNLSNPTSDLTATYKINPKPLTSDMISLTGTNFENNSFTFDGQNHAPTVTVKDGNTTLNTTDHYTLTNPEQSEVGIYYVTVKGKNNYTGTIKVPYSIISNNDESDIHITLDANYDYTYTGSPKKPEVTVTKGTGTSAIQLDGTDNKDYELVYNNNVNAGQASVTVIGKGNYHFVKNQEFTIAKRNLSTDASNTITIAFPSTSPSFVYNGNKQRPVVTVTDSNAPTGAQVLTENKDYTLSEGKINVGTGYTVTVTGMGNYEGSKTSGTYDITTLDMTSTNTIVTLSYNSTVYNRAEQKPDVEKVTVDGIQLNSSTDYTPSYPSADYTNQGTKTITISGKGNFGGSKDVTYVINPKPITSSMVTLSSSNQTSDPFVNNSFTYNGSSHVPVVTVKDGTATLTPSTTAADKDYTLTNAGGTAVGVYYATVEGKGNYTGKVEAPYSIVSNNSDTGVDVTYTENPDNIIYTGSAITLHLTVTKDNSTLTEGKNNDYEVVYNNNINAGEATISVIGRNNYNFVKHIQFIIKPRPLTADMVTLSANNFIYNGSVQKPAITITYNGVRTEGSDYKLTNEGRTDVGTGYYKVEGEGNFTGTLESSSDDMEEKRYTISTLDISSTSTVVSSVQIVLYPLADPVYNGTAKEPGVQKVVVTKSDESQLVFTSGFNVGYSNNIDVATSTTAPTVTISGTNFGTSTASTTFTINPKPLADDMVVLAYTSVAYDGTPKEPGVTVTDAALPATFASKVLTLGTDYTLSYTTDHTTPGDKAASIIGKGNYIGTISKPYTIAGASGVDIALSDPTATFTYNGSAHTPAVTVTKGSGASKVTLAYGTDYSVAYSDNIHAGTNTAYITVTGKGNYDFTQTKTFSIAKKEMTNAMVTLENNTFTYDGNLHKPTVTVSDGTPSIITSDDYTISNDGNINAGDYTVTVTATSSGNYSGSGSQSYTINPLSISSGEVNLSYNSIVFNGSVQKPTVQTVYANGHQLTATTDYTINWPGSDYTNQGAKTVTVTGTGNYKDSKNATYTIEQKEVTSSMIKIANENLTYTASPQTASVTIEDLVGSTNIITADDYTLTNAGGTAVGNYTVSIVGKGNYKGSASKQYSIIAQGATGFTVDEITGTFTYSGSPQTPAVTVKKAGTADVLTLNTDYTVAYTDNTNVGTATVTVTGKGNYSGTRTVNFTITAKTLADGMVALSSTSFTYTGSEQKPVVTVTDMDTNTPLTLNTDYQVIYPTDPISQGTKTITVKGIGNYTGEVAKTYSIGVLSLNDASVTLNELSSYVYDGMEKKPTVKEVLVGTLVVPVTGYTVTYPDDLINIGTKTMTITGKGNYTGSTTKSYVVTPKTVTKEMISLSSENLIYTGSTLKPTVTVKDGAKTLTEGTDYTLSNDGGIEVGTYSLTITGMGNYTGTASRTYNIITKGASVFSVSDIASVTYNGSEQEPEITVVDNSTTPATTLTKGTHYTVAYSNNRNVGLASVTVTGIGSYAGTVSKTFTITPKTLTGAMVTLSATSFVFNSIAQKPEVTIDDKNAANVSIITDNDYTILNNGGINVGDGHEVKVTGKGNYTGTVTKTYAITPLSIATADVTLYQLQSYVYDATAKKPGVREVMVGHVTVPTTGYDVSYGENTNVGTAKVTVTGKGNFKDARTVEFTITGKPITSDMMVLSSENFVYNGGVQKPSVTVKDGSKTLTIGSDYTLTNEGGTSVGNYSVTVVGKGNYTSEASRTYSIVEKDGPTNFTISLSNTSVQYDGSEQKPSVTVTDGTKTLTIDTDYEVSYTNHVNVGTATVTVTGKGNYAGTKTATFTITAKPLTETMVTLSATTFVYNTYLQKPEVTVSDGSLMTGTDYVITNNGGTNQGTYHVIVNGQGNYSGQIDKTFSITPLSIADASVTLYQLQSYVYEGVQKKPGVREVAVGSIIVPTQGFTTTYGDNINAGTATVTVTGQGNYQDTKTVTFDIEQKAVENSMIALSNYEYTYNGEIQKPEVTVRDGETTLLLDTDYTLLNNGGKTVGAYDVTITGKGNYKGTASKTYIINAKEVGSFEVTLSTESVTYNGSEQQPEVTVKDGETVLTKGTHYTVSYTDNVNVGMATITVRGQGEYEGSRNKTFLILPKSLSDAMVSLNTTTFTYNGLLQMPAVTVSDGTALTSNDYYITNEGGLDKGTYNVMVTGRNNYTGTVVRQYAINPMSINDGQIILYQLQSYVYDGTAKNPGVREVAVGSHIIPSTSYTTAISSNINVGTVTVTVTGEKNYTGSTSTTFQILPKPVSSGMITLTPDYFYYNGSVQKPGVTVKDGQKNMVENTDYTVTNNGGTEAGEYEVKVKGIGNYTDEATQSFTILSSGVNTFVVTLEANEYTYDGTAHKPGATVMMNDRTLTEGTDYTLTYSNNTNAGTATVTVKGVGDYTGEQVKTFLIQPKTLTDAMVTLDRTSFIYNEKVQKPEVTVADGTIMTADDYEVTNDGGTTEGTYQVVVTGQNNYKGVVIKSFTITREDIHGDDDPQHPDEKPITYTPTEEGSDEVKVSGIEGTEEELSQVTNVTIPTTFTADGKTYKVVGIATNAFANTPNLTDIYMPDTEEPLVVAEGAIPASVTVHTTLALLDDYALMPSLSESFKAGKIKTTITAKNRYWTFSSGVDVYVPDGVSVYIARERNNATVTIVELSDNDLTVGGQRIIKHNNGVLISSDGNDTPYDLVACGRRMSSGATISTDDFKDYGSQNCLVPVILPTHFGAGYYFLKNNEFHSIQEESEDIKVPAGKAVLYLRQAASSPSYSSIIQLVNTGEVTNINGIEKDADESDWYDMSGRKLDGRPTKKGVYIKNNKKIVIR